MLLAQGLDHRVSPSVDTYPETRWLPWVYSHVWFIGNTSDGEDQDRNPWFKTVARDIVHAIRNVEMYDLSADNPSKALRILRKTLVTVRESFPNVKQIGLYIEQDECWPPFSQPQRDNALEYAQTQAGRLSS